MIEVRVFALKVGLCLAVVLLELLRGQLAYPFLNKLALALFKHIAGLVEHGLASVPGPASGSGLIAILCGGQDIRFCDHRRLIIQLSNLSDKCIDLRLVHGFL